MAELGLTTIAAGSEDFLKLDGQVTYLPTILLFNSRGEMAAEPLVGGQTDLKTVLNERVEQALGHGE